MGLFCLLGTAWANQNDNSLVLGASQEPTVLAGDFLDVLSNTVIKGEIENFLLPNLIGIDLDGQSYPLMITEVPSEDNGRVITTENPDGTRRLEMKLTLRDDIRWSDGTPITTDDIQMYYDVGKAPGVPLLYPDYWERQSLVVQDGQNFTLFFDPAFNTDLTPGRGRPIGYAPAHIMRPAWEETKAQVAQIDPANAEAITEAYRAFFTQFSTPKALNEGKMVYSGAFKFERWVPGSSIDLVRNPEFHIIPPGGADKYVQKVSYQIIQNTNALLIGMISGTIDATANLGVTFDQARSPQLVSRMPGRFDIWFVPAPFFELIEINKFSQVPAVKDLGLDNPKTRQALIMSVNRAELTSAFFSNLQPVTNSWIPFQHPYYTDVEGYSYDSEAAKKLLAELGWQPGPDGILQRQVDGRTVRFELEYVTTSGNVLRERVQQFIAQNLADVGIAVRVNNAPSNVVFADDFSQRASTGAWQGMFMYGWVSELIEDGSLYTCEDLITGRSLIPTQENGFQGQNSGGWCNDEFDALRAKAVLEFDPEAARELFGQMQEIWAREVPVIPLFAHSSPFVVQKGLLNFVSSTYVNGYGYAPAQPWLVGWESKGVQKLFDQSKYGTRYGIQEPAR